MIHKKLFVSITFITFIFFSCSNFINEKLDLGISEGTSGTISWKWDMSTRLRTLQGSSDSTNPFTISQISDVPLNKVKEIDFSENITALGDYAFKGLDNLSILVIPATITSVKVLTFSGISKPDTFECNADTSNWPSGWNTGFVSDIDISKSGTSGTVNYLYKGNTRSLEISGTATESSPFTYNMIPDSIRSAIKIITISSTITALGDYAFAGFTGLTTLDIPATVTYAGKNIFNNLSISNLKICGSAPYSLTYTQSTSATTISNMAHWSNAWSNGYLNPGWLIYSDSSNTYTLLIFGKGAIPDYDSSVQSTFGGYYITTSPWGLLSYSNVIIAEGITCIGVRSFFNCTHVVPNGYLNSISLPSTLTTISVKAFSDLASANITIPSSVTYIYTDAFADWSGYTINLGWSSSDTTQRTLFGLNSSCGATIYY